MKQVKFNANNGSDGHVMVAVHKKKVIINKQGFVPVSGHSMYISHINPEHLQKYYTIPKGITL